MVVSWKRFRGLPRGIIPVFFQNWKKKVCAVYPYRVERRDVIRAKVTKSLPGHPGKNGHRQKTVPKMHMKE
jgi:hypothetical protein